MAACGMPMGVLSQNGGIPRAEMKITEEVKTLIKQLNTCLQMETRKDPYIVAYEHVTMRVANVKKRLNGLTTLHRE